MKRTIPAAVWPLLIGVAVALVGGWVTASFNLNKWRWVLVIALVLLIVIAVVIEVVGREEGRRGTPRPRQTPGANDEVVDRTQLADEIAAAVRAPHTSTHVVVLEGAGGFGKTTLAQQVCRRPEIDKAFRGGLFWVTLGHQADVAAVLNDLCRELGDTRPPLTRAEQAGFRLGELLDTRPPTLLVIDDVWSTTDLQPFLYGAPRCVRLVTTRIPRIAPTFQTIQIAEMGRGEAIQLLHRGLTQVPPPEITEELLTLTHNWALLLSLVNGALRFAAQNRTTPFADEAREIVRKLRDSGPVALDRPSLQDRSLAVGLTIEASLGLLTEAQRERYLELGIFAEDSQIPFELAAAMWSATGGMSTQLARDLWTQLIDLSLLTSAANDSSTVLLHDTLRSYLRGRHDATHDEHRARLNQQFLAAMAARFDLTNAADANEWWRLPASAGYLWRHLSWHLQEAGEVAQRAALLLDLRWVEARLTRQEAGAVEADLATLPGPAAAAVRTVVQQAEHLLVPTVPRQALVDILVSRLDGVDGGASVSAAYLADAPRHSRLVNGWPLPDRIDPAARRVFAGHTEDVNSIAYGETGWLASAGDDGTVRLWGDHEGWQGVVPAHAGRALAVASVPKRADYPHGLVVSAGADARIRLWDPQSKALVAELTGHSDWVRALTVDPTGEWLISGADDQTIRVWRLADFSPAHVFTDVPGRPRCVALSPDSASLAAGTDTGVIRFWDFGRRRFSFDLQHGSSQVWALGFSPAGWLASAGDDAAITIWDMASRAARATFEGHASRIRDLALSPDAGLLASASDDGTIRIWDPSERHPPSVHIGHTGRVHAVAFDRTGTVIATAGADGTVRTWGVNTSVTAVVTPVWGVAASPVRSGPVGSGPAGSGIASAGYDGVLRFWSPGGQRTTAAPVHEGPLLSVCYSPDGTQVATSGDDGVLRLWDSNNGAPLAKLPGHTGWVYTVRYSTDGRWLATSGADGSVRLWDVHAQAQRAELRDPDCEINAVVIASSMEWIASGGDDGVVRIWDFATHNQMQTLSGPQEPVLGLAVSPSERWLAASGSNGGIRVWDRRDAVTELAGHRGPVWAVAFTSDDRWLASAGVDGSIRIWDVASGTCVAMMRVDASLFGCAWTADDSALIAGGPKGVYNFRFTADEQPNVAPLAEATSV
jgi:WD40 repeat protein